MSLIFIVPSAMDLESSAPDSRNVPTDEAL
jgi:hypothetical protein